MISRLIFKFFINPYLHDNPYIDDIIGQSVKSLFEKYKTEIIAQVRKEIIEELVKNGILHW